MQTTVKKHSKLREKLQDAYENDMFNMRREQKHQPMSLEEARQKVPTLFQASSTLSKRGLELRKSLKGELPYFQIVKMPRALGVRDQLQLRPARQSAGLQIQTMQQARLEEIEHRCHGESRVILDLQMKMAKHKFNMQAAYKRQRRKKLVNLLVEMYQVLICQMKMSFEDIRDNQIWPDRPLSHPAAREFLLAVKNGEYKKVKEMILYKSKLLVFEYDRNRMTPLMWACRYNHEELVTLLCLHHSRVNFTDNIGRTALHEAVLNKNLAIVRVLCMHKANPLIVCEQLREDRVWRFDHRKHWDS